MKTMLRITVALSLVTILAACASSYRPIRPDKIYYNAKADDNGLELSYKYDVLNERGNKKYAKKESQKGIKVVAIKITNKTWKTLQFGESIKIFSGDREVQLLEPEVIVKGIKQPSPIYLLYLLLTPMNFYVTNNNETSTYPIGLVVGPGIAFGNMAVAGTANKKLREELIAQSPANKTIQNGETIYGLVGISDRGYNPLTLKVMDGNIPAK